MPKENGMFSLKDEYRRSIRSMNRFAEILDYLSNNKNIKSNLDITDYRYIHPCYAVLLAAIPYVANDTQNNVSITYKRSNKKCVEFLNNSGILKHYVVNNTSEKQKDIRTTLGDFNVLKSENQIEDTIERVLGNLPIEFSTEVYLELFSKIYEIFSNALTHSKSDKVFSCGSLDAQKSLVFSIYDDGIGIPKSVNDYLISQNKKPLNDVDAVLWALCLGNSTLNGITDYPRGVGLDLLVNFANENSGEIIIASGLAYIKIENLKVTKYTLAKPLPGTYFNIIIRRDLSHCYIKKDKIIEKISL